MISNYDVFKDTQNNCYQIRTKSDSYVVEFEEEESEQIFLAIVEALKRDDSISFAKLKNSIPGDATKVLDVLDLLQNYHLLPAQMVAEKSEKAGGEANAIASSLSEKQISLIGEGEAVKSIATLLQKEDYLRSKTYKFNSNVDFEEIVVQSDLVIAEATRWSPKDLNAINVAALAHKKPWLYIGGIEDMSLKIGPLFYGDRTGCYHCLFSRILSNHEYPHFLVSYQDYLIKNEKSAPKDTIPASIQHINILANYAVLEIKKFFEGWALPNTWRSVVKFDVMSMEMTKHKLLKKPYCEVCNPQLEYNPAPWLEAITLN